MRLKTLLALAMVCVCACFSLRIAQAQETDLKVGQRWEYRSRPQDQVSTILIVRKDPGDNGVIFVDIDGIGIQGEPSTLALVPMSEEALRRSVTTLVNSGEKTTYLPAHYEQWRAVRSQGVPFYFDKSVKQAVSTLASRQVAKSSSTTEVAPSDGTVTGEMLNEQIDEYNAAVRLSEEGRNEEALTALDAILENCVHEGFCHKWRQTAEQLRKAMDRNRHADQFNEAVQFANSGNREKAIAILKDLETKVTDQELVRRVRDAIRQLGS